MAVYVLESWLRGIRDRLWLPEKRQTHRKLSAHIDAIGDLLLLGGRNWLGLRDDLGCYSLRRVHAAPFFR